MASTWPVPEGALDEARSFCDTWNQSDHSLVAHLRMTPASLFEARTGVLTLRSDLALPQRVTLKQLVAFLDGCVINAREFWGMARQEAEGWV